MQTHLCFNITCRTKHTYTKRCSSLEFTYIYYIINTVPTKRKNNKILNHCLIIYTYRVFRFQNFRKKPYLPTRFGKTRNSFLDPPTNYLCQRV